MVTAVWLAASSLPVKRQYVCLGCFSHCYDKILDKSNFQEEEGFALIDSSRMQPVMVRKAQYGVKQLVT